MKFRQCLYVMTCALVSFAAVLCLSVGTASAQVAFTGQITGSVTDSSHAVVPHAAVSAQNIQTNVVTTTQTNDSGTYTILSVIPGTYTVTVEQKGFKKFVGENVAVGTDMTARVDAVLELGATTQEITVTAAAPLLKTDRADVAQVVDTNDIAELPVVGRNITELVLLTPGMVHGTWELQGHPENAGDDYHFSVNGQYWGDASRSLDGVDNHEVIQGLSMLVPANDEVQEMKVTTNDYDVEIGSAASVAIQINTKSGSNALHGSLFEYYRDSGMEARNGFSEPTGPALYVWNQFGGSIGGAIKKDKLFFFSDYQGQRNALGGSSLYTYPTEPFRTGDFSQYLGTGPGQYNVYDPMTGNPDGSGRTQFSDPTRATTANPLGLNIIPMNRIQPEASALMALLPSSGPNLGGVTANGVTTFPTDNNFTESGTGTYNISQFTGRIDYNYSSKTRLMGRYSFFQANFNTPNIWGPIAEGPPLGGIVNSGISQTRTQNMVVDYFRVISPTLMVDARWGFSHMVIQELSFDEKLQTANTVGIPGINTGTIYTNGLPQMNINGPVGTWGMGSWGGPFFEHESPLEYDNIWTKVHGNHSIKWGASIKKVYFIRDDANARGVADFDQSTTGDSGLELCATCSTGISQAAFLLGLPYDYNRRVPQSLPQEDQWRDGIFIQDSWKVTPKLTATIGYRWEYFSPVFGPLKGSLVNVDFNNGDVVLNGYSFGGKYMGIPVNPKEMSPRVGLAYRLGSKTVIRAGYGRSYGLDIFGATNAWPSGSWPTAITQTVSGTPFQYVFQMADGPPTNPTPAPPNAQGLVPLPNGVGFSSTGTGTYWHTYVDSWNLTVQHQFTNNLAFEIAYVGNKTSKQWEPINTNAPVPGPGDQNTNRPYYSLYGWTQDITYGHAAGSSNFNGLQARLDRRFSHGVSAGVNFTWSKAISIGDQGVDDPYNLQLSRGDSGYTRNLLSTSTLIYELPFGKGKFLGSNVGKGENMIIGGWQLSGILSLMSGIPYGPYVSNTLLNSDFSLRPDQTASGAISNPTRNMWYNPSVYYYPAAYQEGNTGRNVLKGPDWASTDLSLAKAVQLTERFKLELRMDAINAFNRTNLNTPNNTADSGTAGVISSTITPMRRVQIGAHLRW